MLCCCLFVIRLFPPSVERQSFGFVKTFSVINVYTNKHNWLQPELLLILLILHLWLVQTALTPGKDWANWTLAGEEFSLIFPLQSRSVPRTNTRPQIHTHTYTAIITWPGVSLYCTLKPTCTLMHPEVLCQFFIEFPIDLFLLRKEVNGNLIKVDGKGHGRCVTEQTSDS